MPLNLADTAYQQDHVADTAVHRLIAVFVVCFVISYVSVALRLTSRWLIRSRLGIDDWLVLLSTLLNTAFLSLNIAMTKLGLGRHEVLVKDIRAFFVGYIAVEFLYTATLLTVKLSTLFLWRRLFPGRGFVTSLILVGAVVCAYTITQLVCVMLQCIPLRAMWDASVKGKCIDLTAVYLFYSAFNIATDICIIALPIFRLWRLKMNTKQKLQLAVMFSLGGFVLIISIIRIPQLTEISLMDQTWTLTDSAIWSSLECAVATCSACLPTMRPLFRLGILRSKKSRTVSPVPDEPSRPSFGVRIVESWGLNESILASNHPAPETEQKANSRLSIHLAESAHDMISKSDSREGCD